MPSSFSKKCFNCASLDFESAKQQSCWAGQTCHSKRTYYRKRAELNAKRRQAYREQKQEIPVMKLTVPVETMPVAFLHLVKQSTRTDSPLVEIGATVWQDGKKIAEFEPVSCLGWNAHKVRNYTEQMLTKLHQQFGIGKFSQKVQEVKISR
ncbi:MAG: hypothetical protein HC763_30180 [Hydrococcus sp. CRU_1_1]|nr:hypothetical protein [Hydrococcus sp. CRU_1_1]